jgi:hypothetical protein
MLRKSGYRVEDCEGRDSGPHRAKSGDSTRTVGPHRGANELVGSEGQGDVAFGPTLDKRLGTQDIAAGRQ